MIRAISQNALPVASASEALNVTSQQITLNSEQTSAQASLAANAAQQVSHNLQTVATGAEEMGASIREIAKSATEAANFATSAVDVAATTTTAVSKIGESERFRRTASRRWTRLARSPTLFTRSAASPARSRPRWKNRTPRPTRCRA